jgi:hypothetical protein
MIPFYFEQWNLKLHDIKNNEVMADTYQCLCSLTSISCFPTLYTFVFCIISFLHATSPKSCRLISSPSCKLNAAFKYVVKFIMYRTGPLYYTLKQKMIKKKFIYISTRFIPSLNQLPFYLITNSGRNYCCRYNFTQIY